MTKTISLSVAMLVLHCAGAYAQGKDSLTGLPVIPAAETMLAGKSYGFQPLPMPEGTVCKSKTKEDFYAIQNMNVQDRNVKVSTVVAWYAAHLTGFKKVQGYASNGGQNTGSRLQTAFYNSDGTNVIFITGSAGQHEGEDTVTYSVSYGRYEPGISEKTIASLVQGKLDCR